MVIPPSPNRHARWAKMYSSQADITHPALCKIRTAVLLLDHVRVYAYIVKSKLNQGLQILDKLLRTWKPRSGHTEGVLYHPQCLGLPKCWSIMRLILIWNSTMSSFSSSFVIRLWKQKKEQSSFRREFRL